MAPRLPLLLQADAATTLANKARAKRARPKLPLLLHIMLAATPVQRRRDCRRGHPGAARALGQVLAVVLHPAEQRDELEAVPKAAISLRLCLDLACVRFCNPPPPRRETRFTGHRDLCLAV